MGKFNIVIKQGVEELANVTGRYVSRSELTLAEYEKIPDVEAYLERLTGFRFHIFEV